MCWGSMGAVSLTQSGRCAGDPRGETHRAPGAATMRCPGVPRHPQPGPPGSCRSRVRPPHQQDLGCKPTCPCQVCRARAAGWAAASAWAACMFPASLQKPCPVHQELSSPGHLCPQRKPSPALHWGRRCRHLPFGTYDETCKFASLRNVMMQEKDPVHCCMLKHAHPCLLSPQVTPPGKNLAVKQGETNGRCDRLLLTFLPSKDQKVWK